MHLLFHGLGGFLGVVIGIAIFVPVGHCGSLLSDPLLQKDLLGACGSFVTDDWEVPVTVCGVVGVVIGHIFKSLVEKD